ncbi:SPOR domain-containing protein [Ectothiorhodospiraceae bacterium WFHF3C12]|nr:SPOR domain-containing protein [Ectothiorhodospiraceae bacterium WFHF3C12]
MNNGANSDTLSPAQLQRLGLDTEPFNPAPPAGEPFRDAAIDTQVNVALHILQHTDQVLLVQGADGLGKTSFLTLLNRAAGDELLLLQLRPGTTDPGTDIYRTIAEAGGIDGADETSAVSALLRLSDMGQRPVLMVDDADQVPREVLDVLLAVHATMAQHHVTPGILLTAAKDLVPLISASAREDGLEPHLVNLHPFDEDQTQAYVRDRLRQAGSLDGEQLTETQCRQIHHRTRGNPANINREAMRLLSAAAPVNGESPAASGGNRWLLPTVIVAVVLLVGGLIAATYLVEDSGQTPPVAETPEPPEQQPSKASDGEPSQLPNRKALEEKLRAAQSEAEKARRESEPETGATPAPDGTAAAEDVPSPDTGMAQEQPAEGGQDDGAGEVDQAEQAAADEDATTTQRTEDGRSPVETPEPASPDEGGGEAAEAPEEDAAAGETTAESGAAPDPETEPRPAQESTPAEGETAEPAAPPADHYTIQLIGAYDRESLEGFVADLDLQGETRILTTRREGRDWHVVVYGDYASRASAKAGLQRLPEAARAHGPWIRTFGSL